MTAKLNCAIYTRVSTDNQAEVEFNSCEAQEAKIRAFISSQEGMRVFKVYSDAGYTGANLERPGLKRMLADIRDPGYLPSANSGMTPRKRNDGVDVVIVYKMDRLTRSPRDFYQLIELFEKCGVDFISVTERFDTSTPSGRLLRNIMLTFAQFERELASERTKDKMLQRADKGMWNGGLVPFGYNAINKRLVVNDKDAKVVRTAYDNYIEGCPIAEISKNTGLPKNRISTILKNYIYTGMMKYADKVYQGNHKPIISEDVFKLAQEKHKEKKLVLRLYKDYPLAGLLNCKACNSSMTPCHTNKKKKNRIKRYYYYRCTKTFKKDWGSCAVRQVSANRLEDHIFKSLERISVDKHYIDSLIFKINNSTSSDRIGLPSLRSGQAHHSLNLDHEKSQEGGRSRLEPTQACSESPKISAEIFEQTLRLFVKGLYERKGIEKNLWAKKFIRSIKYCKEEIVVSFYYKSSSDEAKDLYPASGRVGAAAGRSSVSLADKKIIPISTDRDNHEEWLPGLDSNQRPNGYDLLTLP